MHSSLQQWRYECKIGARDCHFENSQCLFIPGEFESLEFGTGFLGFEVGEIYIFFLFQIFRHIFSILALNFGIHIFSIYFSVW